MKYMDTQSIVSVAAVKIIEKDLYEGPGAGVAALEREVNEALADGWELAEMIIDIKNDCAFAQLIKIRRHQS